MISVIKIEILDHDLNFTLNTGLTVAVFCGHNFFLTGRERVG